MRDVFVFNAIQNDALAAETLRLDTTLRLRDDAGKRQILLLITFIYNNAAFICKYVLAYTFYHSKLCYKYICIKSTKNRFSSMADSW